MNSERFAGLSPEEREMMEGATVEATAEEQEAAVKYTPEQQKIIDAFEAAAARDENYKKIVDSIKERGIFEGKGDAFEQIQTALKNLEKTGATPEQIDEALNRQVFKMVERYSETRRAA